MAGRAALISKRCRRTPERPTRCECLVRRPLWTRCRRPLASNRLRVLWAVSPARFRAAPAECSGLRSDTEQGGRGQNVRGRTTVRGISPICLRPRLEPEDARSPRPQSGSRNVGVVPRRPRPVGLSGAGSGAGCWLRRRGTVNRVTVETPARRPKRASGVRLRRRPHSERKRSSTETAPRQCSRGSTLAPSGVPSVNSGLRAVATDGHRGGVRGSTPSGAGERSRAAQHHIARESRYGSA